MGYWSAFLVCGFFSFCQESFFVNSLFCLFFFFMLCRMTGYTGVYLARSKGNLSATLRLACASCIGHDTHTRTDPFSSGPPPTPRSLSVRARTHRSLASVTSLSWERMATAGWWLHVMLCDWLCVCPWCAVVPSIHEHEPLLVSWFLVLGLHSHFPLTLHLRPPVSSFPCTALWRHSSGLSFSFSLSEPKIYLLSFSCFHYTHSVCQ